MAAMGTASGAARGSTAPGVREVPHMVTTDVIGRQVGLGHGKSDVTGLERLNFRTGTSAGGVVVTLLFRKWQAWLSGQHAFRQPTMSERRRNVADCHRTQAAGQTAEAAAPKVHVCRIPARTARRCNRDLALQESPDSPHQSFGRPCSQGLESHAGNGRAHGANAALLAMPARLPLRQCARSLKSSRSSNWGWEHSRLRM
jgi:hypothetical protein